jgi:hypothetical protein
MTIFRTRSKESAQQTGNRISINFGRGRPSGRPKGGFDQPSRFALRRSAVALAQAEDPPLPISSLDAGASRHLPGTRNEARRT